MEYVRYKLDGVWWSDVKKYGDKIAKGGYYLFPYFISDSKATWSGPLTTYKDEKTGIDEFWNKRFNFITEEEFINKTGIPKEALLLIEELLIPISHHPEEDSFINYTDQPEFIMVREILKKYNYGKKVLKPKKIKKCLQKKI